MKIKPLFLLILLLAAPPLGGWGAAQMVLTLDSCQARALRHHTDLRAARLDLSAAEYTRDAARSKYFPTLTANAAYFHSLHPIIDLNSQQSDAEINASVSYNGLSVSGTTIEQMIRDEFGEILDDISIDVNLKALDHGAFAGLMLTQPIFVGGRIINGNRLAQLGVDVAEVQLAMTQDEVLLNVETMYLQVLSLQAKGRTLEEALSMLETLEDDVSIAYNAGLISCNDLLKVRLKRNEFRAQQTQLRNGTNLALRALLQQVGMEYSDTIQYQLDTLTINSQFSVLNSPLNVDDRKEMRLLDAAVKAEELRLKMIVGQGAPQIALTATYGLSNFFGKEFKQNGLALVSLSLPITGRWENYREYQKQEIALLKAQNQRDDLRQKLELQNQQALNSVDEALTLLSIKEQALSDAKDNYSELQSHYQAGLVPTSDYLEAQTLYQQAQSDLIDQQIALHLALTRLRQLNTNSSNP